MTTVLDVVILFPAELKANIAYGMSKSMSGAYCCPP